MKKAIRICVILLFLLPASVFGQMLQESKQIEFYFRLDKYAVDSTYLDNSERLGALTELLNSIQNDSNKQLVSIDINSYTSPEGGRSYNKTLSLHRTESTYKYLTENFEIADSLIQQSHSGIDWAGLEQMVESSDMQYRDEVLHILRTVPEETWRYVKPTDRWLTLVDSRTKHLMDLKGGKPYNYIFEKFYPYLRRGVVVTINFKKIATPAVVEQPYYPTSPLSTLDLPVFYTPAEIEKPILAVKTNLLFDAASLLNVELEVPIGERWSIAGEWIFPWWTTCGGRDNAWNSSKNNPRNTLEILNGNVEARYWLGDRTGKPVLTGWNVGLYAGGGLYDLERNAKGYQGEFFLAAGVSAGYAHTINKRGNLRMEYTVGFGYLETQYRYYEEHWGIDDSWHTIRQYNGSYSWFGPTRARVSLVWLLSHKKRGGSVR